ncbi:NmrA family NAD(P)-binding protein [Phormidium sp. FACHB-592]|uniref:NmrA family NAD(P)-binding protein n=1 Tax=Stenomitos frigidus AS-A4 TaxID=2933935 RepID=A0ABV0KU08_9CYAN|nr:NmrA family NAD(P)-binding protein [Phormidium sp. FACHB-592]MBD2077184.1 NmrA family NAD(P)-binding protein [Phormidium sp. FACHB-592]
MFVVFGATGQTGSVVADILLEKLPVRVVLRSDKNADAWRAKGADVAFADVTDAISMTKALNGAIAVYAMNPPAYHAADMFTVAKNIGAAYVEAIMRSGVQKVVLLSSVGSQHATGTGNILTTYFLENIFGDLAIPVVFLRAAGFMENWNSVAAIAAKKGILPSFYSPLDRKLPMVSAADIGRAAAEALTENWTGKRIIELHGALDYSPNNVAAAFAAALKRNVQAVALSESEWQATIAGFGFSPAFSNSYSEMMRGFNSGHIVFENNGTETRKGQTTIEAFAANTVKAQNLI